MLVLPHSHLFIGHSLTVVISGPHIQIVDTLTGKIQHSTLNDGGAVKSGPVRCAALDKVGKHLLTSGEDKILKLWEIDGLKLVNQRELPKRPTAVRFTSDGQTILASDKFGDVFSYPFQYTPPPHEGQQQQRKQHQRDSLSSHENPSGGQLLLGHTSLLNAFLLSADEKYIITADRDEHIRVSWFPQGYNIEMYCLGHTKFISAIHNPPFSPSELVSGGGDPMLKIWSWMDGVVKHEIPVWDAVEPFLVVRGGKRKRGEHGEGRWKGKGKKAKGNGKGKMKGKGTPQKAETEAEHAEAIAAGNLRQEEEAEATQGVDPQQEMESEDKREKVLVIHKIDTLSSCGTHHLIFNAVGAMALFTSTYPEGDLASGPDIRAFDFGRPVIDFFISSEGLIWVLLDGNWTQDSPRASTENLRFVRILEFSSGELIEQASKSHLLISLNTSSLLQATLDDIKKLDLYNDLTAMPKTFTETDQEQDGEVVLPEDIETPVNKKILGRMKNKRAVQERLQRVNVVSEAMPSSADEEDEGKERRQRRQKLCMKSDDGHDVDMTDTRRM